MTDNGVVWNEIKKRERQERVNEVDQSLRIPVGPPPEYYPEKPARDYTPKPQRYDM